MHGSEVEGLSQTTIIGSQWFLSDTLSYTLSKQSTTPGLPDSYRQVRGFEIFEGPRQDVEKLDQPLNVPIHGQCITHTFSVLVFYDTK